MRASPNTSDRSNQLVAAVGEDLGLAWRREHELLETIAAYWYGRGFSVDLRVERIGTIHGAVFWGVRSNLVSGMPISRNLSVKGRSQLK